MKRIVTRLFDFGKAKVTKKTEFDKVENADPEQKTRLPVAGVIAKPLDIVATPILPLETIYSAAGAAGAK